MGSSQLPLCNTILPVCWEKSPCEWTFTGQTHAVHRSTVLVWEFKYEHLWCKLPYVSPASALSYTFWYVVLSFSCRSVSSLIPLLPYELFSSRVLFNFQVSGDFPVIFLLLLSGWLHSIWFFCSVFECISLSFFVVVLKITLCIRSYHSLVGSTFYLSNRT